MSRRPRSRDDDFFCWKYQVWYGLKDCVFRHGWETTPECADCEQGAANMKLVGPPEKPPRWARLPSVDVPGRGRR